MLPSLGASSTGRSWNRASGGGLKRFELAPFRALAQLDLGERGLADVVRAGIHCFNTDDELAKAVQIVADLV